MTLDSLFLSLAMVGILAATALPAPVDALESARATLKRNDDGQVVEVLFHHHTELSESALRELAGLKHLRRLGLASPRLTNDHLARYLGKVVVVVNIASR